MTTRHLHQAGDENVVDVGHYGRVLRDHKLLLVLGALLGLLAGGLAAQVTGPSYTADTQVVVSPSGVPDRALNIATERQIASSTAVAERVQTELADSATPGQLLSGLQVSFPNNSSVLAFTYSSSDPAIAQERSQAFADAYLELRREQGEDALAELVTTAEDRLATLQAEQVAARGELAAAAPGSPEQQDATARLGILQVQLNQTQRRIGVLGAVSVEPGDVIQPAALPAAGGNVTWILLVVSIGFLGLLLAAMLAFLLARADKRVRRASDAERELQIPVLATLGDRLPDGGATVAHEVLGVRLMVAARDASHHTIVLTAPHVGRDSGSLASTLAATLVGRGMRVVLVNALGREGDPRESAPGRSGALRTMGLAAAPDASLEAEQVRRLLAAARAEADIVFVSAPPVLRSAETLLLAVESDAVVLVAEAGVTRYDEIDEAATRLEEVGSTVLGIVLLPSPGRVRRIGRGKQKTADPPAGHDRRSLPATEPVKAR